MAKAAGRKAEKVPQNDAPELCPAWVVNAWGLWVSGVKNWSEIARQVRHDRETVKRNVTAYSETLAALLTGGKPNPLAEYVQGLYCDMSAQAEMATDAEVTFVTKDGEVVIRPDYGTRVRARREVTECRKLIAAAVGVITERKGVQHGEDPDHPFRWWEAVRAAGDESGE